MTVNTPSNMYNKTVYNKPTAAFVLSLIGGIIGLIVSAFLLILYAAAASQIAYYSSYYSSYYYSSYQAALSAMYLYGALGVWCLISCIFVIAGAIALYSNPLKHTRWGVVILVFSILGVGGILGLVGGILALTFHPETTLPYQQGFYQAPPPVNRICLQCGKVLNDNAKFCPNCGKELA